MTTNATRTFTLTTRADSSDEFDVSLASSYPVDRGGFIEVLELSASAVDLSRAVDGLPLLADHGTKRLGRVQALRVQGAKLRGRLKLFDTPSGREARAEIDGGHREVSIGYEILKSQREGAETVRVTRWRPYEASIVAVPADPTVGLNRSIPRDTNTMSTNSNDLTGDADHDTDLSRAQRRAAGRQAQADTERVQTIQRLARSYSQWLKPEDVGDAIANGTSTDQFNDLLLRRMESGHTDISQSYGAPAFIRSHGDPESRLTQFSLSRAVLSSIDPAAHGREAGLEHEISRELQRRGGIRSQGMMVPFDTLFVGRGRRDLLSESGGGEVLIQTTVLPEYVQVLRQRSVVMAMGAVVLPGLTGPLVLPRQSVASEVAWHSEAAELGETQPDFEPVTLSPKRVGGYVEISRQVQMGSVVGTDQMLREDLSRSCLTELDRVALGGAAADPKIPKGIRYTAGIGLVVGGANGANLNWGHILAMEAAVDDPNAMTDLSSCGYVINPATRAYLKRTPKNATLAEGLIMGDALIDAEGFAVLNGYRAGVTAHQPKNITKGSGTNLSLLTFGDFSQLTIGIFAGGVELIVDPYTLATAGKVRVTANLYADIGLRQPAAFAIMADAALPA